ncbi:MAG: hypothetical protein WCV86_03175 [Patescibacteria group bacterium]|jgi:Tfp pilus assembly protein PilN
MITLNLISKEKRSWLAEIRRFAYAKVIASIGIAVIILASGYLFAIQAILNDRLSVVRDEITVVEAQLPKRGDSTLDDSIRALNAQTQHLADLYNKNISYSVLMNEIGQSVTPGIVLEKISLNTLTSSLVLTGTAKTRDNLLAFQDALTALPYIDEMNTPLSTFTQRENIPFDYNISLNLEAIIAAQQS